MSRKKAVRKRKNALLKRTNIHIDPGLMRRISSRVRLKSQRAIVDHALRTTGDLLELREDVNAAIGQVYGITRGTEIFPQGYADAVRGRVREGT